MLISGITTFPIACSSSLILQAIFVYPSEECDLPVEKETSVKEELVLEPKRFPAGAAIFVVIIILYKLLQYRSGGTSEGSNLTHFPDFLPFRVFNPEYHTLVYREKVDEVSVLTVDSVDARNLEYAEALNSECERLYWIHYFDL